MTSIELHPDERATGRENFDFYCFLIWPYIEAAWLGAISLFMLAPPPTVATTTDSEPWVDFKQAQDLAQLLGKTLYHQGDLSYYEAVNKEALRNAYTRQEEEGIVLVSRVKEGEAQPKVRLDPAWMPVRDEHGRLKAEGLLWEFCEKISMGRREGKNLGEGGLLGGYGGGEIVSFHWFSLQFLVPVGDGCVDFPYRPADSGVKVKLAWLGIWSVHHCSPHPR